jgi:hypothetical protein
LLVRNKGKKGATSLAFWWSRIILTISARSTSGSQMPMPESVFSALSIHFYEQPVRTKPLVRRTLRVC